MPTRDRTSRSFFFSFPSLTLYSLTEQSEFFFELRKGETMTLSLIQKANKRGKYLLNPFALWFCLKEKKTNTHARKRNKVYKPRKKQTSKTQLAGLVFHEGHLRAGQITFSSLSFQGSRFTTDCKSHMFPARFLVPCFLGRCR